MAPPASMVRLFPAVSAVVCLSIHTFLAACHESDNICVGLAVPIPTNPESTLRYEFQFQEIRAFAVAVLFHLYTAIPTDQLVLVALPYLSIACHTQVSGVTSISNSVPDEAMVHRLT